MATMKILDVEHQPPLGSTCLQRLTTRRVRTMDGVGPPSCPLPRSVRAVVVTGGRAGQEQHTLRCFTFTVNAVGPDWPPVRLGVVPMPSKIGRS